MIINLYQYLYLNLKEIKGYEVTWLEKDFDSDSEPQINPNHLLLVTSQSNIIDQIWSESELLIDCI